MLFAIYDSYLNNPEVFEKIVNVINDLRDEFERATARYPAATRYKALSAFDQIVDWQFRDMVYRVQDFITKDSKLIREHLGSNADMWAVQIRKFVVSMEFQSSNLAIGRTGMKIATFASSWISPGEGVNFAGDEE